MYYNERLYHCQTSLFVHVKTFQVFLKFSNAIVILTIILSDIVYKLLAVPGQSKSQSFSLCFRPYFLVIEVAKLVEQHYRNKLCNPSAVRLTDD